MKKFELIKPLPGRKVGDIAVFLSIKEMESVKNGGLIEEGQYFPKIEFYWEKPNNSHIISKDKQNHPIYNDLNIVPYDCSIFTDYFKFIYDTSVEYLTEEQFETIEKSAKVWQSLNSELRFGQCFVNLLKIIHPELLNNIEQFGCKFFYDDREYNEFKRLATNIY